MSEIEKFFKEMQMIQALEIPAELAYVIGRIQNLGLERSSEYELDFVLNLIRGIIIEWRSGEISREVKLEVLNDIRNFNIGDAMRKIQQDKARRLPSNLGQVVDNIASIEKKSEDDGNPRLLDRSESAPPKVEYFYQPQTSNISPIRIPIIIPKPDLQSEPKPTPLHNIKPLEPPADIIRPIESIQPIQYIRQPIQHISQPIQPISQPISQTIQPISQPIQPISQTIQPIIQPFQPISQPIQHISQPISQTIQPISRTIQPIQPIIQPIPPIQPNQPVQLISKPIQLIKPMNPPNLKVENNERCKLCELELSQERVYETMTCKHKFHISCIKGHISNLLGLDVICPYPSCTRHLKNEIVNIKCLAEDPDPAPSKIPQAPIKIDCNPYPRSISPINTPQNLIPSYPSSNPSTTPSFIKCGSCARPCQAQNQSFFNCTYCNASYCILCKSRYLSNHSCTSPTPKFIPYSSQRPRTFLCNKCNQDTYLCRCPSSSELRSNFKIINGRLICKVCDQEVSLCRCPSHRLKSIR